MTVRPESEAEGKKSDRPTAFDFHGYRNKPRRHHNQIQRESLEEWIARGGVVQQGGSVTCLELTFDRLCEIIENDT